MSETAHDAVNHPKHYNAHPSGMECIELVEMLPFCEGNAIKYLWRADHKGARVEDLKKALWYAKKSQQATLYLRVRYPGLVREEAARAATGFSRAVGDAILALSSGDAEAAISIIEALIEQAAMESAHDA